ncbi:MAG: hypothetical protein A7315_14730 [Candidatus Altiarchaeales archaeon WOR_SM1_79]|nr:MAG: hypothetical protein A7315_14730 [Candidatus Altiarchaeales archaeon WOR_SM1_79]
MFDEDKILIYAKKVEKRDKKLEEWFKSIRYTWKPFENAYKLKDLVKDRLRNLWNKKFCGAVPKIETVLEKGKSKDAKFFRSWGPEWIDFEEGFVVERPDVNEILEKFENKNLIVIKGNPASGKSVILRNIGFKLANQGKDVYVIELKHPAPEIKDVLKLKQGYLFIDDAHLNLEYVNDIVRDLSGVKILVSTRGIEERFGPTSFLKIPEYLKGAIEIKGYDAAEGIIQKFSEKRKKIPEEIKEKLTKNNLWILAWELESYEEYGRIDEGTVCERVKDYTRKDLKNSGVRDAENVLLPLSVFYKYETPLRKKFVEEFAEYEDIEKLVELNEINKLEENGFEYLTLHHSETAKIFLKTFQKFDGFGNKVKENIGGDWSERLFHMYVQEFPKESVWVINSIWFKESKFTKNLVEEHFDEVKEGIESENDIERISGCIWGISKGSKEVAEKLVKSLDLENLKNKIEVEKNIKKISCIEKITWVSKEVAEKLVKSLDLEKLKDRIEAEEDVGKIGWCIYGIAKGSKEVAEKLVKSLDLENLKNKIEVEKNIGKINSCILWIDDGSKEVAEKLVKSLDLEKLKDKIEAEEDIREIGDCIREIAWGSREVAERLVNNLDVKKLKDRIGVEENIVKIGWCIWGIAKGSKKVAEALIPVVKLKIDAEKDARKIGSCIMVISLGDKEVASKLVNQLDPDKAKSPKVRRYLIELKKQYQR